MPYFTASALVRYRASAPSVPRNRVRPCVATVLRTTTVWISAVGLGSLGLADDQTDRLPTPLPHQVEAMWVEVDGDVFGARPNDEGPIGGGAGYQRIVTSGDYHVTNRPELIEALETAQPGQVVFVDPEAVIDFTVWVRIDNLVIDVPEGVTLASNRGEEGAPGALLFSDEFDTSPLIRATGPNVRITGLRIRGPDADRRMDLHRAAFGPGGGGHPYYYRFPVSRGIQSRHAGLEVDNCELWAWSHSAVSVSRGDRHRIHHNHIHHNQRHGLGYGVTINQSEVDIEYNLFDWNRHSIAGTGRASSGYAARHNIVLSNANSHQFDMHGGRDRRDGTNIAGSWMEFTNNTFVNTEVNAIVIRGVPEREAVVTKNWFHDRRPGRRAVRSDGKTRVEDNVYGVPARKREE
jgi:hypothetical protein